MLAGCGSSPASTTPDTGMSDASNQNPDSGSRDAGTSDSGNPDAGSDAGTNRPPVAANATVSTAEDSPLSVTLPGTDPDGDPITWTLGAPSHGTITGSAPSVTYTPAADYAGNDTVTVEVSDGTLSVSITVTIVVTPVDDAPVATDDTAIATDEDTALTIAAATLLANDTDIDTSPLVIASVSGATNGTVVLSGTNVIFTPSAGFNGNASFVYTVGVGAGSDTATVTVPVTSVVDGVVAMDDAISGTEDVPITLTTASLLANDVAGDVGTVSFDQITTQTGVVVSVTGGTITVTAPANFSGDAASFDYQITDGPTTDVGHVAIHIDPAADAPVAVSDAVSTNEDLPLVFAASTLLSNDTDADGDLLSVVSLGAASTGTVALAGGNITFTPTANASGSATFSYVVSDGSSTSSAVVTVTIVPVDDAPVAVDDTAVPIDEDTFATISASSLLANDSDIDSATLVVTGVSSAVNGTVALAGATITFTPSANFNGVASFQYTATADGKTAAATVSITVNGVLDPMVANDDTATGSEDSSFAIPASALLANDVRGDGAALTLEAITGTNICAAGFDGTSVIVTCANNYEGPDAWFDYQVSDGVTSDIARVALTIAGVNDAPQVSDEDFTGTEDTPIDITAAELLANDLDADGDTLTITGFSAYGGATVTRVGDVFTFTPALDAVKNHGFTYTVSDGTTTTEGHAAFWLLEVNDAPRPVDDEITMQEDTVYINGADLFRINDPDPDSEVDSVHVIAVTGDTHCVASLASVGGDLSVSSTPGDWSGTCTVTYTVSDGFLSATGHIVVTVEPANDAPIGVDDTITVAQDSMTPLLGSALTANDTDEENDVLRVVEIADAVDVVVWLSNDEMTVIPSTGFVGTATFRYRVEDSSWSSWASVSVVVNPAACGDGTHQSSEPCDDSNTDEMDGCLSTCKRAAPCNGAAIPGAFGLALDPTNGHCYAGFLANVTWTAGNDACHALGGQLAVIESAAEDAIVDPVAPHDSYIGFTDWNDEEYFSGLGGLEPSYFAWTAGQPDSATGNEDCVSIRDGGEWRDAGCDELLNYVCEISVCGDGVLDNGEQCDDGNLDELDGCSSSCSGTPRCGDGVIVEGEECDDGNVDDFDGCTSACFAGPSCDPSRYTEFEDGAVDAATGNCFLRSVFGASWNDAQAACVALTDVDRVGSLPVIEDIDTNWIVRFAGGADGWIGATDQAVEGEMVDPFGQPLSYTNWEPGEPNDSSGNEDCVMIYASGRWNDAQCTDLRSYACELQ